MTNENSSPVTSDLEDVAHVNGAPDAPDAPELSSGDTFEIDGERFVALHVVGDHKAGESRFVTYIKGYGDVIHTTSLEDIADELSIITPLQNMVPFGVTIAVTPEEQYLGEVFNRLLLQSMRINVDRYTAFNIRDVATNTISDPATADNAVGYWNNAQVEIMQEDDINGGVPYVHMTLWGIVDPELLDDPEQFRQSRDISSFYHTQVSHVEVADDEGNFTIVPEMSINLVKEIEDGTFEEAGDADTAGDDEITAEGSGSSTIQ